MIQFWFLRQWVSIWKCHWIWNDLVLILKASDLIWLDSDSLVSGSDLGGLFHFTVSVLLNLIRSDLVLIPKAASQYLTVALNLMWLTSWGYTLPHWTLLLFIVLDLSWHRAGHGWLVSHSAHVPQFSVFHSVWSSATESSQPRLTETSVMTLVKTVMEWSGRERESVCLSGVCLSRVGASLLTGFSARAVL